MATPRFVAAPQVTDYASQILAIHEEGFRRRLAAAEKAQDEKYTRDTTAYANRVAAAAAALKAANAEVAAAKKAVLDVELKDAKGAADALRTVGQLTQSRANAAALADAVRGKSSTVPAWVRTDVSDDKIQTLVSGLTRWDQVYPDYTDKDDDPKYADRELIDQALAEVDKAPVSHGVKKVLAVGWMVAHDKIPKTISMESLKEAAVREALGANPVNWDGVSAQISDGYEALNPEGSPLVTDVGEMLTAVNALVDLGSKEGNNPDEAADSLERGKKGGAGAAKAKAKVEAIDSALSDPSQFRPDYTDARGLAAQRLTDAEKARDDVEIPTQEEFLDRIARTRNQYATSYGEKSARRTPEPDPVLALIAEIQRKPAPKKEPPAPPDVALSPEAKAARTRVVERTLLLGPKADTPEAKRAEAAADEVIRAPVQAPPAPKKPTHPGIELLQGMGLYDMNDSAGELDMSTVPVTEQHRPLLEKEGLIARDGSVRRTRASRLASTTAEGRLAQSALDAAGGDLAKALATLRSDRAKAIAVGLQA